MEPRAVTESPSALLERAAATLAERAERATPGPWRSDAHEQCPEGANVLTSDGRSLFGSACCGGHCYGYVNTAEDAAWIATLAPPAAQPLVEWLRAEAEYIKGIRSWKYLPGNTRRAVDFARVVLGEPE